MWLKLHFLCPKKIFEKIFVFFTKSSIFLQRIWAEQFGLLAKVIWLGCQKVFQVSRGYFRENCSFKTNSSIWFRFLDFVHKNFGLLAKKVRSVRQNCIQCVQSRFLSELFFYEFFQLLDCFPTVGRTFCNIVSKTLENLLQLHSTWTTKLFEEKLFSEENT